LRKTGNNWVLGFLGLAGGAILGYLLLGWGFATAGERMTRRLRQSAFEAIVRHDIGWFDSSKSSLLSGFAKITIHFCTHF
jgi:ABC-type multidrug transport system fused ATPase/permease subunit